MIEVKIHPEVLRVGVVADTHVPDRFPGIPAELLTKLRELRVDRILHAGDICIPEVLKDLGEIAPVTAVRGNRDFLLRGSLPVIQNLDLNGVPLALVHGNGTILQYVLDQFAYIFEGYKVERYIRMLAAVTDGARVIVFGHTHRPANEVRDGKLYFNPGSATLGPIEGGYPSFGLLRFFADGNVIGEIIELTQKDEIQP